MTTPNCGPSARRMAAALTLTLGLTLSLGLVCAGLAQAAPPHRGGGGGRGGGAMAGAHGFRGGPGPAQRGGFGSRGDRGGFGARRGFGGYDGYLWGGWYGGYYPAPPLIYDDPDAYPYDCYPPDMFVPTDRSRYQWCR